MKSDSLPITAMRASRVLAALACLASIGVLACWAQIPGWMVAHAAALPPPLAAVAIYALGLAVLLVGFAPLAARFGAQLLAVLGGGLALQALVQTWSGASFGTDLVLFPEALLRLHGAAFAHPGRMAATVSLTLSAIALAVLVVPFHGRAASRLFAFSASAGLLIITTSLVGLALDNASLASLGLDRVPTLAATVLAAMLLVGSLGLRRDAGWLSVLWDATATGGLARGMVVWTVVAPLAVALIVLAGVRAGYYSLDFAFALLAAAMCGGLTFLVLWNAARVDRATRRAESAREAEQLAANRLRLAQSATGVQMWEWTPRTREWLALDGQERLDPSTNEYLESGLARCLRDGKSEFEFPVRRPGIEDQWMLATCWREMRDGGYVVVGVTVDITERKFAILALEASETRLQLAARALPGFVYDWNWASGKLVRTSGIERLLGFEGAELSPASRWWDDLVHPEDRATARPARVARASGADSDVDSIACEYRVRHKNGGYVWIWDHCILVRNRAGEVIRVVGSVLDITERKETLARLATSEHRFKATLLATTGIIWTHDAEGRAVGEQTSWSAFTGQTNEELAGLGWMRALHPDDITTTSDAWRYAIATARDLTTVHRVRRRDGVYRTFSVHAVPVTNERGEVVEWVGSHTDITEQREAEQRVRESMQRLELALDAASVGMWDWDVSSGRMTWTRQTHLITGVSEEQFSNRAEQFFGMLEPADQDHAATFKSEVTHAGAVKESELEIRRPDGTRRWVQNRAAAIFDAGGRMRRIVGTLRDITRRKELEVEREGLLSAERAARVELGTAVQAKDEFLATISHELRTPLNAILGWASLLQRPNVESKTIADGLKVIERNARAQTQLLGDLLDANQMMSGKLSLSFEPMDLNDAVRATLDSMRVTIAARRINIENRMSDGPLPVMGDSGRLQQIVSNLLSNALKFTPTEGVVTVTTRLDEDAVYCDVRDSGEGIAAEFLPHIFEKFRQADVGSARRFAGLGLGLAIAKQLVESHGGSIHVSSEGRGKGASFSVRLPRLRPDSGELHDLDAHRYHGTRATDKPLAGLSILAVDDEADSRDYLERLLVEQGAEIVSVASAQEAIDALMNGGRFNLLVSDIGMPGSTGYDLIDVVRQHLKVDESELPAVALTAFTRPQDRKQALDRGFQKHLAKPVQVGRLIGAIRQLTGRSQSDTRHARRH
jgi:PAS domain S-box-containing protein